MAETAWLILTVLSWTPTTLYLLDYGRKGWWRSPIGWYMFLQALVIWLLLSAIMLALIIGPLGPLVWIPLIAFLTATQWSLFVIYRRVQYGKGQDQMNQPEPTQAKHPARASARTALAVAVPALITFLELAPVIARAAGIEKVAWVAGFLGVCAAITRVLAVPAVINFFRKYVPFLAPDDEPAS